MNAFNNKQKHLRFHYWPMLAPPPSPYKKSCMTCTITLIKTLRHTYTQSLYTWSSYMYIIQLIGFIFLFWRHGVMYMYKTVPNNLSNDCMLSIVAGHNHLNGICMVEATNIQLCLCLPEEESSSVSTKSICCSLPTLPSMTMYFITSVSL